MTTTIIGIIVTALAIEVDKLTQYRHRSFPLVVLAGEGFDAALFQQRHLFGVA